jgi:prevent-host-death family protein
MKKTMIALQCKDKFMALVDEVVATGESIIVTRNGRPVGVIEPYVPQPQGFLATKKALSKS